MLSLRFSNEIMPKGAGLLFLIKLFFIITYSIVFSTLILYISHQLHFPHHKAAKITATFLAYAGIFRLVTGFIGDRYLSYQHILVIGFISLFVGCLLVSIPNTATLYWGISAIMLGSGLMIAPNCILTQLFPTHDHYREAAFYLNYVGINLGYMIGFSVSGYYQLSNAYSELFQLAAIAALIALLIILFNWQRLRFKSSEARLNKRNDLFQSMKGITLIIFIFCLARWFLEHLNISNIFINSAAILMGLIIIYFALQQTNQAIRNKLILFLSLSLISIVFWTLSNLTPILLTLFIENNVNRNYLGMIIAPQWVQIINSLVIILGAPLVILFFNFLNKKGIGLKLATKFSIALILVGASLIVLAIGVKFSNIEGLTNFNWILISYILQSLGELFIVPVGFAMVGQLIEVDLQGRMMAVWMMLMGVGANLAGYISSDFLLINQTTNPHLTNASYIVTFTTLGWLATFTGALLILCTSYQLKLITKKLRWSGTQNNLPNSTPTLKKSP